MAKNSSRVATVARKTAETDIVLTLGVDGAGVSKIDTGVPFFDHMLTLFAKHGLFDLTRIDILAARHDEVGASRMQVKTALFVECTEIARIVKALLIEGIWKIVGEPAEHQGRRANADATAFAHLHFDPLERCARTVV